MSLAGTFPMLPTSFDHDGRMLVADLPRLIDHVVAEGAEGLALLGLAGEGAHLSAEERLATVDTVMRHVATDIPVIVTATSNELPTALRLARHAAEHGAAAVMIAPPSATKLGPEEMFEHYAVLAAAVHPTPVMVQDAPTFLGVALDAQLICALASETDNIQYAKTEAVPAGQAVRDLAPAREQGTVIFGGQAGLHAIDVLDAGAAGLIPGCEIISPLSQLVRAHRLGDRDTAIALHRQVLPLLNFMFQSLDFYLACTKTLLHRRGVLSSDRTRTPAVVHPASLTALSAYAAEALP